ncbi:hypothetical protein H0H81_007387 [Sphagnurus paluster]|uniref:Rhodanese domain-containing protein n=1 Tax=Sphagnurus paluster TaxID=117069 RepID=A0A9P7FT74_9AGAR|nr:hypothetical protein H0H81_007387 [Sphagnurus paluster]
MPVDTKLNVFSGEDGLRDFYDPDKNIPVPLVELPARLNPYRKDGVRIYAKLMSHLPATNVKSLPALNMILRAQENGSITPETDTILEFSSGSTVISLGIISNIIGIPKVKAYISNKTSQIKLQLLQFFGMELTLFGGPVQPEPQDRDGGIFVATEHGREPGVFNPDQYSNKENYLAHMRWSGPQIYAQLPEISVFVASVGTSGTLTGTSLSLKKLKPSVTSVGVLTAPNDRVPGPRNFNMLVPVVEFPWREAMDVMEEVDSFCSYERSLELCRNGILVGPSSGLALTGLLNFLKKRKDAGTLDALRNPAGEIPCVFICCDQPFQYIAEYFEKLGPSYFQPIKNEELFATDLYPYNIDWELTPEKAYQMLYTTKRQTVEAERKIFMLDIRDGANFRASHLDGFRNLDIDCDSRPNPYKDPATLVLLFDRLKLRFAMTDPEFGRPLQDKTVILLSKDGQASKLATSILRNRGVEAYYVIGGVQGFKASGLWGSAPRAYL